MTSSIMDDAAKSTQEGSAQASSLRARLALGLAWSLFFIAWVLPYGSFSHWWKFIPATVVMLACQRYLHPGHWRDFLGLAAPRDTWMRAGLLLSCVAFAGHFLVHHIAAQHGVHAPGPWFNVYRLLPWCQVLNEEMFFRALLLGVFVRRGANARWVSWASALLFVASHVAIYRWGIATTWLLPQTAVTLLCFALSTNEMYLRSGNIAYPVAVHLGWNLTRFGSFWQFPDVGWQKAEVYGFNTFEAHPAVVLASVLGCAAVHLWFPKWQRLQPQALPNKRRDAACQSD